MALGNLGEVGISLKSTFKSSALSSVPNLRRQRTYFSLSHVNKPHRLKIPSHRFFKLFYGAAYSLQASGGTHSSPSPVAFSSLDLS